MSTEDIIVSLVLGALGGLLIFAAVVMARRGNPWTLAPPRRPTNVPANDHRHVASTPLPPDGLSGIRPLAVLFKLDSLLFVAVRLVLIAMVLYGVWVVPRLRWVLLGAAGTFTLLFLVWRRVARWLHARGGTG